MKRLTFPCAVCVLLITTMGNCVARAGGDKTRGVMKDIEGNVIPRTMADPPVIADQMPVFGFTQQSDTNGLPEGEIGVERPAADFLQTTGSTRFTGEHFLSLPAGDMRALIATSASTYKGFTRGGRIFETKTLVDGIDVTDQYAGWVNDVAGGTTPYIVYNAAMPTQQASTSSLIDLSRLAIEEAAVLANGTGADFNSATAGIISYTLKEGRGPWTTRAEARVGVQGYKNLGPDAYADDSVYFRIRDAYARSSSQADKDKAKRFTYIGNKYSYGRTPDILFELGTGGSVTEDIALYVAGRYFDSHGFLPNEHTRKVNASLTANYNVSPDMKLRATALLEDRGKLFGWKNSVYSEDYRYFLEGVPKWDGANVVGGLKFTHVLSPGTYYEVQASFVGDNSRRGYCDDNNDGIVQPDEDGDFLEWADTAQVHRYTASVTGTQWDKFFTLRARHETGSENTVRISGVTNLKIARPSIYYENFKSDVTTLKADIASRITENHLLRGGFQARLHNLDMTRRADYAGGWFPQNKDYVEELWNLKPKEYCIHAQDVMEYAGWVIDIGLRLEAFDLAAGDFANFFAPYTDTKDAAGGDVRVPVRGGRAPIRWSLSPSIGGSYQIGAKASVYFSYARQQQPQPFSRLYANYNDFGNPSLPSVVRVHQDPIRSTNYDLGLQCEFLDGYALDVDAYAKDIQSYGSMTVAVTPGAPWKLYSISTEGGYAVARGIEVSLRKSMAPVANFLSIGGRIAYTYSSLKQGVTVSGGNFAFSTANGDSAACGGQLPWDEINFGNTTAQDVLGGYSVLTGGYDRPHRLTYNLYVKFPLEMVLSSIGTFQSGFYFPLTLPAPRKRELGQSPMTKQIDIRIEKAFSVTGLGRFAVYLDVINLFGWENIIAYNTSAIGQKAMETSDDPTGGPTINRPVALDAAGRNDGSMVYDVPRQVFVGVSVSF
jgi:hypothetical protein